MSDAAIWSGQQPQAAPVDQTEATAMGTRAGTDFNVNIEQLRYTKLELR